MCRWGWWSAYYQENEYVKYARHTRKIDEKLTDYLLSNAPIAERLAVINAVSWDNGQVDSTTFERIASTRNSGTLFSPEKLSADLNAIYGYLLLMDNWDDTERPRHYIETAQMKLPRSKAIAMLDAMMLGQKNMETVPCNVFLAGKRVVENRDLYVDINDEAIAIFKEYMYIYANECSNEAPPLITPSMEIKSLIDGTLKFGTVEENSPHEEEILHLIVQLDGIKKPPKSDPKQAREENALGLNLLKKGMVNDAIAHLENAFRLDPSDAEVVNNLGYAYMEADKTDAEKAYFLALALSPRRVAAWANLGEYYARNLRPKETDAAFSHAYRFSKNKEAFLTYLEGLPNKSDRYLVREACKKSLALLKKRSDKSTQGTPSIL